MEVPQTQEQLQFANALKCLAEMGRQRDDARTQLAAVRTRLAEAEGANRLERLANGDRLISLSHLDELPEKIKRELRGKLLCLGRIGD